MLKRILSLVVLITVASTTRAQVLTFSQPDVIPVKLERLSPALRDMPEHPPTESELNGVRPVHDNPSLEHPMHAVNPNALPVGEDPALQKTSNERQNEPINVASVSVLSNWAGLTAAVEPSDNNIAVGPNHVVQMANNNISTYIRIWDKLADTILVSNKLVQSITGITDYGDPNVLYDQLADRYLMVVLYSKTQKKLVVCISQTADPTGAYYVYSFATPNGFPDYPKIGVWGNSYFITTNSKYPSIYALNRAAMIHGQSMGTAQMFSLSKFPNLSFQSASPVSQTGATAPPAGEPATIIRVADDAWGTSVGSDHLELFNLSIDWTNSSNSTITGPIKLPTIAYNSNLCGFSSSGCIPQPGSSTKLDPLSDIVMDKVQYRNIGIYESIVCSHVCNADGNGTAGIRWYELRRSNGSWYIYQQSTYAAGTDSRFMPSITINNSGTIALGYNISSGSVYPGMRFTGRNTCDAINIMSVPETVAKVGSAANSSNRYGDYNGIVTDPSDGSFWFTANYNPTSNWSTNVVHFTITDCPPLRESPSDNTVAYHFSIAPNPASTEIKISFNSVSMQNAMLQIVDITGKTVIEKVLPLTTGNNSVAMDIQSLSNGCYFVKMIAESGTSVQRILIAR